MKISEAVKTQPSVLDVHPARKEMGLARLPIGELRNVLKQFPKHRIVAKTTEPVTVDGQGGFGLARGV